MTDLKLPTRPAPEPPKLRPSRVSSHHATSKPSSAYCTNVESFKLSRSQSAGKLAGNKQPPPRPPPPPLKLLKNSKSITSFFPFGKKQAVAKSVPQGRPGSKIVKSETCSSLSGTDSSAGADLLIDLNSPPSSPTLTARTSSDNYSLNSYSSVTNSQIESGFEDDFDSLIISSSTSVSQGDPWGDTLISDRKHTLESAPAFELSNEDPKSRYKPVNNTSSTPSIKPTIIRPKSKPARPPPPKLRPASTPPTLASQPVDWSLPPEDWSPPMPSCPPPPPPPEAISGPSLPPRPSKLVQSNDEKKKPYCIAAYDYETGHQDDLSFKVNDVIYLTEQVNADWLRGKLNNKEGMFPSNFVQVVVPLETSEEDKSKCVIALYNFVPQTWDDLSFQEGDTVKVIRRINEQWLYGECNGKQGQFPENYVTDISSLHPYPTHS